MIAAQSKLSELAPRVETALGAKLAWHAAVGAEKAAKALNAVSHAELHQHLISAEGTSRAYAAQFWRILAQLFSHGLTSTTGTSRRGASTPS